MDQKLPLERSTTQSKATLSPYQVTCPEQAPATTSIQNEYAQPPPDPDDYLAWPDWSKIAPALLLLSNWLLLIGLASHLDSLFAQLVLLPLCMVGVAVAWGWHRD